MSLPVLTVALVAEGRDRVRVVVDGVPGAVVPRVELEAASQPPVPTGLALRAAGVRLWRALRLDPETVERPRLWRLAVEDRALAALPWEAIAFPGGGDGSPVRFLFARGGAGHRIVRLVTGRRREAPEPGGDVLLVLAQPEGAAPLSLVPEALGLLEVWEAAGRRVQVEVVTRPEHLVTVLAAGGPFGTVHVTAHGLPGATAVDGAGGAPALFSWQEALETVGWRPVLLVLNQCHGADGAAGSAGQAEACSAAGVPVVVAASGPVEDAGAVELARLLHRAAEAAEDEPIAERLAAVRQKLDPAGDLWWRLRVVEGPAPAPAGWPPPADTSVSRRTVIDLPGLPAPLAPRPAVLREVLAALQGVGDRRALWLWGEGGSGKTVLLGLAANLLRLAAPVVAAVSCRGLDGPGALVDRLAAELGVEPPAAGAAPVRARALLDALPAPRILLLDDLSEVQEDDGTVPAPWADLLRTLAASGTRLAVSSRVRPRFEGDQAGSEAEGFRLLELGGMSREEAAAYLAARVGSDGGFPGVEDGDAWRWIESHVGTHPLSLSLVAGAIREEGWRAVREDPGIVLGGARDRFLDRMWEVLTADEATARLVHALAVLEVPVPRTALRRLAGPAALERLDRWSVLEGPLVDGKRWAAPHPVIATDWRRRLPGALPEEARRKLASRVADVLASEGERLGIAELQVEAARLFLEAGRTADAVALLGAGLDEALDRLGRWALRERLLRRLLEAEDLEPADRAAALHNLANTLQRLGDPSEAERLYREALVVFQGLGDRLGIARTVHNLAALAQHRGDLDEAERLYREALEIFEELGERSGIPSSLHQLGVLAYLRGDIDGAERLYRQALEIRQELHDRSGIAGTLHNLATLAQERGELDQAERLYREALDIFEKIGERLGIARTLHELGNLAQIRGDLDEAEQLYREALEIRQELYDRSGIAGTLHNLAVLAQSRGDLDEAERLYRQALEIEKDLGNRSGTAGTLQQLGMLAQSRSDLGEAERLYRQALEIFDEIGERLGVASTLHQMGNLAYLRGDLDEAERLYGEALESKKKLGDVLGLGRTTGQLALLAEARGDLEAALEGHLEAERLFRKAGAMGDAGVARFRIARILAERERFEDAAQIAATALALVLRGRPVVAPEVAGLLLRLAEQIGRERLQRAFEAALGDLAGAVWEVWCRLVELEG